MLCCGGWFTASLARGSRRNLRRIAHQSVGGNRAWRGAHRDAARGGIDVVVAVALLRRIDIDDDIDNDYEGLSSVSFVVVVAVAVDVALLRRIGIDDDIDNDYGIRAPTRPMTGLPC